MTIAEENKVQQEVLKELILAFKFERIDYFLLDAKTRYLIMIGFQTGIKYWTDRTIDRDLK